MPDDDDGDLWQEAFAAWLKDGRPCVIERLVRGRVGKAEAEDAVQNALVYMLKHPPRNVTDPKKLELIVFWKATRCNLDAVRSRKRVQERDRAAAEMMMAPDLGANARHQQEADGVLNDEKRRLIVSIPIVAKKLAALCKVHADPEDRCVLLGKGNNLGGAMLRLQRLVEHAETEAELEYVRDLLELILDTVRHSVDAALRSQDFGIYLWATVPCLGDDGELTWYSKRELADRYNYSPRHVGRLLKKLAKNGLIHPAGSKADIT